MGKGITVTTTIGQHVRIFVSGKSVPLSGIVIYQQTGATAYSIYRGPIVSTLGDADVIAGFLDGAISMHNLIFTDPISVTELTLYSSAAVTYTIWLQFKTDFDG